MRRLLAIALTAAAFAAAGLQNAYAQTVGTLTFGPAAGQDITPMSAFTSGLCPGGTNLQMKVFGKGFAADGVSVTGNTGQDIYPRTPNGGFEVPLQNTMRAFADEQDPPAKLGGDYRFVVTCRAKLSAETFGEFTGVLTFASPTRYISARAGSAGSPASSLTSAQRVAPGSGATRSGDPQALAPLDSPTAQVGLPSPAVARGRANPVPHRERTSLLPRALLVTAVVGILVGAVAIAIAKSGRKQAFIRP